MQFSVALILGASALAAAQFVPPPAPVLLNSTKSGVLPVLPTPFNGTLTLEGAIIMKAPVNSSYVPLLGPAMTQTNLPAATYVATLPAVPFDELTGTIINGTVTGYSNQGNTGTTWVIRLSGLPNLTTYGPFAYHVHNMPVPSDGNCTGTMGHFDPTNGGEYYTCDVNNPQNCQAGDLSGKHGKIMTSPTFNATYVDYFLSTSPNSSYFFGAKSIVIHTMNTTRLTCANLTMVAAGTATTNSTATNTTSPTTTKSGTAAATFSGEAVKIVAGTTFAGLLVLLGFML